MLDTNVIACGSSHTVAVTDDGLYTWGYNGYGQLGVGSTTNQSTPQKVTGIGHVVTHTETKVSILWLW